MEIKYLLEHDYNDTAFVMAYNVSENPDDRFQVKWAENKLDLMRDIRQRGTENNKKQDKLYSYARIGKIITEEIKNLTKFVPFEKNMSACDANALIDELLDDALPETKKIDTAVEKAFKLQNKELHMQYQNYLFERTGETLADLSKAEILKIVYDIKPKLKDAIKIKFDSVFGKTSWISEEQKNQAKTNIKGMDTETKKNLISLLEKTNFNIRANYGDFVNIRHKRFDETMKIDPVSSANINPKDAISRVANELLRDAIQYEYFKKTNNPEIFFSNKKLTEIPKLSNDDILEKHAKAGIQYHKDAYVLGERIKELGNDGAAVGVFVSEIKNASGKTMPNQDIIKMYFDILKTNFNKFNIQESEKLQDFANFLANKSKDTRIAQQIRDTFGIKPEVYTPFRTAQDEVKKKESIKRLKETANRIENGDYVSGAVIANKTADLVNEYSVIPTKETYKKIKKQTELSAIQKKILQKHNRA
ncbi:MAG: hypothetical protein K5912_03020 [Alphaproteobacteria bacterium]|nr:hypothetical protein [Alphaproteobacteria bacterium]